MGKIKTITFVGIGNMGAPMAANLIRSGFDVAVFDVRVETARAFVQQYGGRAGNGLQESARGSDAIITMLPDDSSVRQVLLDPELTTTLAKDAVAIDMGTSDPCKSREVASELRKRNIAYLDAPVMGGVVFAKDATLDIMVGGDDDAMDRCLPVFNALGKTVTRCGKSGAGHALKALANYVNACSLINMLEAMTIGKKYGLDTETMKASLQLMCTGRQNPLEKKIIPHVLTRKYSTGMPIGLIAKDVTIVVNFGRSIGAVAPLAEEVRDIWIEGRNAFGATADQTEIVKLWEHRSGVTL